ncbi:TPA: helix-turn-helix domain-containing protein [Serratia fonticola]|nr:helix-turn-helix domain-containing protein [Serratia fonticola]
MDNNNFITRHSKSNLKKGSSNSPDLIGPVIEEICEWIDSNICDNMHINEIARRSGYSKWHFQRKFREKKGLPLSEYVRYRRLEIAMKLLSTTEMPILDVAFASGVSSQQQLSRLFKTFLCITPGTFRRQARRGGSEYVVTGSGINPITFGFIACNN